MSSRITIAELAFYLAFLLYCIASFISYTAWFSELQNENTLRCIKAVAYALCAIAVLLSINPIPEMAITSVVVLLVMLIAVAYQIVVNDGKSLFAVLLFGFAFRGKNFEFFVKFAYFFFMVLFILTIGMCFFGFLNNVVSTTSKYGIEFIRASLGFIYPGQLQMAVLVLTLMHYYVRRNRINVFDNVFIISLNVVFFLFSQTIMPLFMALVAIVITNYLRNRNFRWNPRTEILVAIMPWVCAAIALGLIGLFYCQVDLAIYLDDLTNHRLSLGATALQKYGITLFGTGFQNIANETEYLFLDSEYIYLLVSNGAVYLMACLAMLSMLLMYCYRQHNAQLLATIILLLINSIFNNGIFNLLYNPFIILLVRSIYIIATFNEQSQRT